jgi:hypothetical protein
MKHRLILACALLVVGAGALRAQDDEEIKFPYDTGPDTIDVSKYPKEQQDNYTVFAAKCSKCHTLARPINSPYAVAEEWSAYVNRMQHKKHSGVDEDSAKKIASFLIYDSSIRKKDAVAEKEKLKKEGKFKIEFYDQRKKAEAAGDKKDVDGQKDSSKGKSDKAGQ